MRWRRARRAGGGERYRRIALFAGCDERELRRVGQIGTRLKVAAGRRLTTAGEPGAEVVVVLSGVASCRVESKVVASFGDGDFFGEVATLDGGPRTATVVAVTDMEVLVLDRSEFQALIALSPEVASRILLAMARRLRSASGVAA